MEEQHLQDIKNENLPTHRDTMEDKLQATSRSSWKAQQSDLTHNCLSALLMDLLE